MDLLSGLIRGSNVGLPITKKHTVNLEIFYFRSRSQLQKLILRKCMHTTKGLLLRKIFNTKINHTKVSYHENFQIYGMHSATVALSRSNIIVS